ncbi:MAG: hypothetical protein V1662_05100, partial [Candidatus Omnitrophota bacterium]
MMNQDKTDAQLNRRDLSKGVKGRGTGRQGGAMSSEAELSLWFDPRSKRWIKVVACVLIGAFLHQDIVWAVGPRYTDDLKLMFESPKEKLIEQLGALLSASGAYAFDNRGIGESTLTGYQYTDYGASLQRMQTLSQMNPVTGVPNAFGGVDIPVGISSTGDYQWGTYTGVGEMDKFLQGQSGWNDQLGCLSSANNPDFAQTIRSAENYMDKLADVTPIKFKGVSSVAYTGADAPNRPVLNVQGGLHYNNPEVNYAKAFVPSYGGVVGYNIQAVGLNTNDMRGVSQAQSAQYFLGAYLGRSDAFIYPLNNSYKFDQKKEVFNIDGQQFAGKGVDLFFPITPNSAQAQLTPDHRFTVNNQTAAQLDGKRTWLSGAVNIENGQLAFDTQQNTAWGFATIANIPVLLSASQNINAGIADNWPKRDVTGEKEGTRDLKNYVVANQECGYGMRSTGGDNVELYQAQGTSNQVRIIDSSVQPGPWDDVRMQSGEHITGVGNSAAVRQAEYLPYEGKAKLTFSPEGNLNFHPDAGQGRIRNLQDAKLDNYTYQGSSSSAELVGYAGGLSAQNGEVKQYLAEDKRFSNKVLGMPQTLSLNKNTAFVYSSSGAQGDVAAGSSFTTNNSAPQKLKENLSNSDFAQIQHSGLTFSRPYLAPEKNAVYNFPAAEMGNNLPNLPQTAALGQTTAMENGQPAADKKIRAAYIQGKGSTGTAIFNNGHLGVNLDSGQMNIGEGLYFDAANLGRQVDFQNGTSLVIPTATGANRHNFGLDGKDAAFVVQNGVPVWTNMNSQFQAAQHSFSEATRVKDPSGKEYLLQSISSFKDLNVQANFDGQGGVSWQKLGDNPIAVISRSFLENGSGDILAKGISAGLLEEKGKQLYSRETGASGVNHQRWTETGEILRPTGLVQQKEMNRSAADNPAGALNPQPSASPRGEQVTSQDITVAEVKFLDKFGGKIAEVNLKENALTHVDLLRARTDVGRGLYTNVAQEGYSVALRGTARYGYSIPLAGGKSYDAEILAARFGDTGKFALNKQGIPQLSFPATNKDTLPALQVALSAAPRDYLHTDKEGFVHIPDGQPNLYFTIAGQPYLGYELPSNGGQTKGAPIGKTRIDFDSDGNGSLIPTGITYGKGINGGSVAPLNIDPAVSYASKTEIGRGEYLVKEILQKEGVTREFKQGWTQRLDNILSKDNAAGPQALADFFRSEFNIDLNDPKDTVNLARTTQEKGWGINRTGLSRLVGKDGQVDSLAAAGLLWDSWRNIPENIILETSGSAQGAGFWRVHPQERASGGNPRVSPMTVDGRTARIKESTLSIKLSEQYSPWQNKENLTRVETASIKWDAAGNKTIVNAGRGLALVDAKYEHLGVMKTFADNIPYFSFNPADGAPGGASVPKAGLVRVANITGYTDSDKASRFDLFSRWTLDGSSTFGITNGNLASAEMFNYGKYVIDGKPGSNQRDWVPLGLPGMSVNEWKPGSTISRNEQGYTFGPGSARSPLFASGGLKENYTIELGKDIRGLSELKLNGKNILPDLLKSIEKIKKEQKGSVAVNFNTVGSMLGESALVQIARENRDVLRKEGFVYPKESFVVYGQDAVFEWKNKLWKPTTDTLKNGQIAAGPLVYRDPNNPDEKYLKLGYLGSKWDEELGGLTHSWGGAYELVGGMNSKYLPMRLQNILYNPKPGAKQESSPAQTNKPITLDLASYRNVGLARPGQVIDSPLGGIIDMDFSGFDSKGKQINRVTYLDNIDNPNMQATFGMAGTRIILPGTVQGDVFDKTHQEVEKIGLSFALKSAQGRMERTFFNGGINFDKNGLFMDNRTGMWDRTSLTNKAVKDAPYTITS